MDADAFEVLKKIEQHLAVIAEAAAARIKRSNGRDQTKAKSRSITPEDKPTKEHMELAERLGINMGAEWSKFKNYCLAHDTKYASFEAAFRKWLLNNAHKGKVLL